MNYKRSKIRGNREQKALIGNLDILQGRVIESPKLKYLTKVHDALVPNQKLFTLDERVAYVTKKIRVEKDPKADDTGPKPPPSLPPPRFQPPPDEPPPPYQHPPPKPKPTPPPKPLRSFGDPFVPKPAPPPTYQPSSPKKIFVAGRVGAGSLRWYEMSDLPKGLSDYEYYTPTAESSDAREIRPEWFEWVQKNIPKIGQEGESRWKKSDPSYKTFKEFVKVHNIF